MSALELGRAAMRRGEWKDAQRAFEQAIRKSPSAEAHEGLSMAGWWLDQADVVFDSRERAYLAYLDRKDTLGAARLALLIGWDYATFRGEHAVTHGWMRRAHQLLEGHGDCAERAWLNLREGNAALFEDGDPERTRALAEEAIRISCAVGQIDIEMVGRALAGIAIAVSGDVVEGMHALDGVNAAVLAGELSDPIAIALACCYLVVACERVRDTDRAVQWCNRLRKFCRTWGLRPLLAVCRTQYASVCVWSGDWSEAERELTTATEELAASRPAMTADGLVRLAELRRRQGRLEDALALLDQTPAFPASLAVRAAVALDSGESTEAARLAERGLRQLPATNRVERAPLVEILARAHAAAGALESARAALAELHDTARIAGTPPLAAAASAVDGVIALAAGDAPSARRHLEDAVDGFERLQAPFDEARTRLDLARAIDASGHRAAAVAEVRRALARFESMAATRDLDRARAMLTGLGGSSAARDVAAAGLTKRELEVVRLIAAGHNNGAVARRLFISEHTVHRHVANVFSKLGVPTRSAAVARAASLKLL
jgi:LuxR family maltose regulon positive regulatory protein